MMQLKSMMTRGKQAMREFLKLIHERQRKIISLVIAVTFVFSMTGIDVILVHAFDDTRHENYNATESLHAPANPLADSNPEAFMEISTDETSNEPVLSDTKLNVLKAEYGDLLNTVSLQTVAEQSTGGMNLENAVINVLQDQGQVLEDGQPAESGEDAEMPEVDPALIAEATSTGQGPLSFTLEMGSIDIGVRMEEGNSEIVRLPVPVVAMQEEEGATEPTEAVTEVAEAEEGTIGATVATNETQPQPDVLITPNEQTNQDQTIPENAEQPEGTEVVDVPDDQSGETPAETAEGEETEESEGTLADLANEFLSRLGLGTEDQKEDVMTVEDATAETKDDVVTEEGQEEENETVGQETENTDEIVVTDGEEGEEGETIPGTEEDEGEDVLPGEESPEEIAAKEDEGDGEESEDEETLPELIAALLLGEDEGETEGEVDTELLESIMDELSEGMPELEDGSEVEEEGEIDIAALLDEMNIELDTEGMPAEAEEISSVLVGDEEAPEEDQGEEAPEDETGDEEVLVTNTDSAHADEAETSLVGPDSTLEDEKMVEEDDEDGEEEAEEGEETVDAATVAKENDVLEQDLSEYTKEASAVNVLKSMNLDLPSGEEAGYMKKLGTSFKDGIDIITGKNQIDTNFIKGLSESGVDPKNLEVPEEMGMTIQELPEQIDANMKLVMDKVKTNIKQGKDEVSRLKLMSVMAVSGLLEEGNATPNAPDVDTDPEFQEWSGNHGVSGSDPWSISEMYSHPEPPKEEQPDPECTDYLSFGIVVLIFGPFVEFKNFLENPSWETFGEFLWTMSSPLTHLVYELVNFDWEELANYGEFAQSPFGKIIMLIISIILTIVTFGSAAPILIAIIILIEIIQMFIPLPEWLDVALSIVKAALGGWASAIKDMAKEALKQGIKMVITTITGLIENWTPAVFKSILKQLLKESIIQIARIWVEEDFILTTLVSLGASVLANGLADLLSGEGGFLEGLEEGFMEIMGMEGSITTLPAQLGLKTLASPLVKAIASVCIQMAVMKGYDNQGQGMRAGAIWGALASGTLGYVGTQASLGTFGGGERIPLEPMQEVGVFLHQVVRPVVAAAISSFFQTMQPKMDEKWKTNQLKLPGSIASSFGEQLVPGYTMQDGGQWTQVFTEFSSAMNPEVEMQEPEVAAQNAAGTYGDEGGANAGAGAAGTEGVVAGASVNAPGAQPVGATANPAMSGPGMMVDGLEVNAAEMDMVESETSESITDSVESTQATDQSSARTDSAPTQDQSQSRSRPSSAPQTSQSRSEQPQTDTDIDSPAQDNTAPSPDVEAPLDQAQPLSYDAPPSPETDTTDLPQENNDHQESTQPATNHLRDDMPDQQPQQQKSIADLNAMGGTETETRHGDRVERRDDDVPVGGDAEGSSGGGDGSGSGDGAGGNGTGSEEDTPMVEGVNESVLGNVVSHRTALQSGQLNINSTVQEGTNVSSQNVSSGNIANNSSLGQAVNNLKSMGTLPREGTFDLKIETFQNSAGNQVMAISSIDPTTGGTQLLSMTENFGSDHITTALSPNADGSVNASVFAGDSQGDYRMGGDVRINDLDVTNGIPTGNAGVSDPVSGLNRIAAEMSGRRLETGDSMRSDGLRSAGDDVPGAPTTESDPLSRSLGDERDGVPLAHIEGATTGGGPGHGPSGGETIPGGTQPGGAAAGEGVELNLSNSESLDVSLSADGETLTLNADDVTLNAAEGSALSTQGGGTGGSTGGSGVEGAGTGGQEVQVTLSNGQQVSGTLSSDGSTVEVSTNDVTSRDGNALANNDGTPVSAERLAGTATAGHSASEQPGNGDVQPASDGTAPANGDPGAGQDRSLSGDPSDAGAGQGAVGSGDRDAGQIAGPDAGNPSVTNAGDTNAPSDQDSDAAAGGTPRSMDSDQAVTAGADDPDVTTTNNNDSAVADQANPASGTDEAPGYDVENSRIDQKLTHRIIGLGSPDGQEGLVTITVPVDGQDVVLQVRQSEYQTNPAIPLDSDHVASVRVKGSDNNWYFVQISLSGEVQGISRQQVVGSWVNRQVGMEQIGPHGPTGQTVVMRQGQVYQIYARDGETGDWNLTDQRHYTRDPNTGMIVSAIFPVSFMKNVPHAEQAGMVMAAQSNLSNLAGNPAFLDEMKAKGNHPQSEAFQKALRARAMTLAQTGVMMAQQHLSSIQTEMQTQLTENGVISPELTAHYQAAHGALAFAEYQVYTMKDNQGPIASIVGHALASNNPYMQLIAANLQVSHHQTDQAISMVSAAFRLIQNDSSMPVSVKLELSIQVMEILNNAGRTDAAVFNQAAQYAASFIDARSSSSAMNFGQAVRLLNLSDQTVIDQPTIARLQTRVTAMVNRYAARLAPSESIHIDNVGTLTRSIDGRLTLQQASDGYSTTISFTADESSRTGRVQVESVTLTDGEGERVTFKMQDGALSLFQHRVTVKTERDGRVVTLNVMVRADMITNNGTSATVFHQEDGKSYLVEINLQTNAVVTMNSAFDRDNHEFITQGTPLDLTSGTRVSFRLEDGKLISVIKGRHQAVTSIPTVTVQHLTTLGIPENVATLMARDMAGKPAFMASDGTLIIGTQADIIAGNYHVAGLTTFTGSTETLGYFARYENGVVRRVDLSDQRIVTFLQGGTQFYKVTQYSPDGQRVMVSLYNNGNLIGAKMILRDYNNLTLTYDREGTITQESLRRLRTHPIEGISVTFKAGQGFTVLNEQTNQKIKFSMTGRHVLEPNGFQDQEGGTAKGLQDSMEFDIQRTMSFNVAGYNYQGVNITVHTQESYSVAVSLSEQGKLSRVMTRTDFFNARDPFVQHTEGFVRNETTGRFSWTLQQVRASEGYLRENNFWPAKAFNANRAETNPQRYLQADQYNLFTVGISDGKLTLMGRTVNGAMGFCSVETKPNHLGVQVDNYSFGATGSPEQLRELGLHIDELRTQNQADLSQRLIVDDHGRYTVVESNGSHTLQGQTANGTLAFLTQDKNNHFTFGGTGTLAQLDELELDATTLVETNQQDTQGTDSRQIQATFEGHYTVVESENGSHTLQGKLDDGTSAFVTIDRRGKYSFGATATIVKLDNLGMRASELHALNLADELGEASREILPTDEKFTMIETEDGVNTIQGKTLNGADAFASLDNDGNYSFGATADNLTLLDNLGLRATEIHNRALRDTGHAAAREILAKEGNYTAIDSFKEYGRHNHTLQGRAANGADVWASLDHQDKYSYGGNGTLSQLDALGLDATTLLNRTVADLNGDASREILADDGKYTVVQTGTSYTLQGLTRNGAMAFATLKGNKYTYGATANTTQLDQLGLRGTDLTTRNQADTKGSESRTILADGSGNYTVVQDGSSHTLQGRTENGAHAFVTMTSSNKYTFGASAPSLRLLDQLGLQASNLAGRAYNDTGNGETVRRSIGRRDGMYTAVDSNGTYTLQGVAANGASAFATLSNGNFSFGASGTQEQLDALGLECTDLVTENVEDLAGTDSRRIQAESGTGYYTVVQNGDVKTLQGELADGTKAFFSKNTIDGSYSFGATANRAKLDALGLNGSRLLDHNADDMAGADSRVIQAEEGLYTVVDSYSSFTLQGKLDDGTQAFTSMDLDGNFSFGATSENIDKLVSLGLRSDDILRQTMQDGRGSVSRMLEGNDKGEFTGVDANGTFTLQGKTLNGADGFATLDGEGNYSFGATGTLAQLNELGLRGSWLLEQNTRGSWADSREIQGRGKNGDQFTVVQSENSLTIQGKLLNGADGFFTYNSESDDFTFGATGTQAQLEALGLRGNFLISNNRSDRGNDNCTDSRRIMPRAGDRYTIVHSGTNRTLQGKLNDGTVAFASVDREGNYSFGATASEAKLNRLGLRGTALLAHNLADIGHQDSRLIQANDDNHYTVVETKDTDTLQGKLSDGTTAFLSITTGEGNNVSFSFGASSESLTKLDRLGLNAVDLHDQSEEGHDGRRTILPKDGKYTAIESAEGGYTLQGVTSNGATAFMSRSANGGYSFGATGSLAQLDELDLRGTDMQTKNAADAEAFLEEGDFDSNDGLNHDRTIQTDLDGNYTVIDNEGSLTMQGKLSDGTAAFATLDKDGKFSFGATATREKLEALGMPCDDLLEHTTHDESGNFYMGTHRVEERRIQPDSKGRFTVITNEDGDMTLQGKTANGAQAFISLSEGKYTYGATGTIEQLDGLNLKGTYLTGRNSLLDGDKRIVSSDGKYTVVQNEKSFVLQGKNAAGENVSLSRDESGGYTYSETRVLTDNEGTEVKVGVSTQVGITGRLNGDNNVSIGEGDDAASVSMGRNVRISVNSDNEIVLQDARGVKEVYSQSGERETGRWQRIKNGYHKFEDNVMQAFEAFENRVDAIWNWVTFDGSLKEIGKSLIAILVTISEAFWYVVAVIAYTVELILTVAWEIVEIAIVNSMDYNPATAGLSWVVGELTGKTMGEWLLAGIKKVVEIAFWPIDQIFKYVGMAIAWIGEQFSLMSEALFHFMGNANSIVGQIVGAIVGALAFVFGFALQFAGENLAIIIIVTLSILFPPLAVVGMVLLAKDAILHGAGNMFRQFFIEPFTKLSTGIAMFANMSQLDQDISRVRVVTKALLVIGGALVGLVFAFLMIKGMIGKAKVLFEKMYSKKMLQHIQKSALSPRQLAKKPIGELVREACGDNAANRLPPDIANTPFGQLRFSNHKGSINSMLKQKGGAQKVSNLLKSKQFRLSELSMNGKPLTATLNAKALGVNGFARAAMMVGSFIGAFFIHQVDIFRNAGKAVFNLAKGKIQYSTRTGIAKTADIRNTSLFKNVSKGAAKMVQGAKSIVRGSSQSSSKSVRTAEKGLSTETAVSENVSVEVKGSTGKTSTTVSSRQQAGPGSGQGTSAQQSKALAALKGKVASAQAKLQKAIASGKASPRQIAALKGQVTRAQNAVAKSMGVSASQAKMQMAQENLSQARTRQGRAMAKAEIARLKAEGRVEAAKGRKAASQNEVAKLKKQIKDLGKNPEKMEARQALERKLDSAKADLRSAKADARIAETEMEAASLQGDLAQAQKSLKTESMSRTRKSTLNAKVTELKAKLKQNALKNNAQNAQKQIADLEAKLDRITGDAEVRQALAKKGGFEREIAGAEKNFAKQQKKIDKAQNTQTQNKIKDLLNQAQAKDPAAANAKAGTLEKALDKVLKETAGKVNRATLKQMLADVLAADPSARNTARQIRDLFQGEAGQQLIKNMVKNGMRHQAKQIFDKLLKENGVTLEEGMKNALREQMGLGNGAKVSGKLSRASMERALEDVFGMERGSGRNQLFNQNHAQAQYRANQKMINDVQQLQGKSQAEVRKGLERILNERFGKAHKEMGMSRSVRKQTIQQVAKTLSAKQLQRLLASDSPIEMLRSLKKGPGQTVNEINGKAQAPKTTAEKPLVESMAKGQAGAPALNVQGAAKRMQQLANAKLKHQQAVAKLNQSTTLKGRASALKAVERSANKLKAVERAADARAEAGGMISEMGLKMQMQGGLKGLAGEMLPETIKVRQGLKAASAEAEIGTSIETKKIVESKAAVEKTVQEKTGMSGEKAKAAVNELMTLRENMMKLEQVSEQAAKVHRQQRSKNANSTMTKKAAQVRSEARQNFETMKKAFDAKMAELKLTKADLKNLAKYDQALARADVTAEIEKAWNDHYKEVYEKAAANGKLKAYEANMKQFDAAINKVLDRVPAEAVKAKGGAAYHEAFMEYRQKMIDAGKLEIGSAQDVQMVQSYAQRVMAKITGYPGLRVSQQIMLGEFLRGNNIGLRAGGGKTLPFIMFPGQIRMLMGKVLRAELLVDDPAAIDKYIGEKFGKTGLAHQDLAKAMGMELVNGNNMYLKAQKTGNFGELIKALNDPAKTVVFDHTTRAHLRNAAMRNADLHSALKSTNLVGIDEVHMPATSQTSAIVGGQVKAPTEAVVNNVNKLLDALKFDAKGFQKVFENYQQKFVNNNRAFANKKVMLGEFEVIRDINMTNAKAGQYNMRGRKTIVITESEVFLNTAAQKALKGFKGADVSATMKTLFSQQGKAGELNSYKVANGHIYPVDNLGKIQYEQISNDITGQIVAAKKAGLNPFSAVRVNTTSMQTSLSAMYAGNNGARIVGASGTIAGLENLMQSKIGSGSIHLSTSRFNVQGDILNTGGKILTDTAIADRIVTDSVTQQRRNALVFETDPAMQLKLVKNYMAEITGKVKGIPSISVISASGTGYFVPKGQASAFMKQLNIQNANVLKGAASPVKGLDYIELKKAGIQTIVENVGNKSLKGNHICIFNEQAAVGKNFQADLTLVARNTTALTADMFTQLLLRSGRPGGPNGSWTTTRYAVLDAPKLRANLDIIRTRSAELGKIWATDPQMTQLLKGLSKTDLSTMNLNNQQTLANALKLNGEFRQAELVGNATRFSVQDTFKDKLVIEPLKQTLQSSSFANNRAIQNILNRQMSKVLNERASQVDISLKTQSSLTPEQINNQYVRSTFLSSVQQARGVWGFKGVLGQALIPTNFFRGGWRLVGMSMKNYGSLIYKAPRVVQGKLLENAPSFADVQVGQFHELYTAGHRLMQGVLSLNSGGMQAAKLQNATVAINRAVNQNQVPSRTATTEFRKAWGESHNAVKGIVSQHGYTTEAVTMVANQLGVTANVARIAMAENFNQATQMLQYQMRNNRQMTGSEAPYQGPATAPGALPALTKPMQLAGMSSFGKWMKGLPLVSPMLNSFDARMASTTNAAFDVREMQANYNSPTWQAQNQATVQSYQQQFGENWVEGAMAETFGPDVAALKNFGSVKTGLQRTLATLRQPAQGRQAYAQTLHNIQTVSQRIPELQADSHKTITYQGQTMSLSQTKTYLNNQVSAASSLSARYGLNQGKTLNFLSQNNHWSKHDDTISTRANVMQRAAASELTQQNWFSRGMEYVGQKWQGMLDTLVRTPMITPLFVSENGKIKPATTTKLITGAAALAVLSISGVGVPLMGTALLGLASGIVLKPLLARITPHMATKNAAAEKLAAKKPQSILMRVGLPAAMLIAGIFFQQPMMVGAAVGTLNSEVVEHVMSTNNPSELTVNERGGYLREKQMKKAKGDKTQETMAAKAKEERSVVEEWKEVMGEEKDGKQSTEALRDILQKRHVKMVAGPAAQHYGYMHMLAALVSLVPQALNNISHLEIGEKLEQKELEQLDKAKQSVVIDQGSIKFLDQNFSEIILTQLLQAMTEKLFADATSFTLKETLRQHHLFKEYGENSLVEFMKQFITDGQSLWALCSGDQSLRKVYEQIAETLGREYTQNDLGELTAAAGELENEAVGLMKQKAQEISRANEEVRPVLETEFEAVFGVSLETYNKMLNPPLAQRILTLLVSKTQLQGTDPVVAVKSVGQQLMGAGVTLVVAGGLVLGLLTGILPVILGIAAAVVGLAVATQGLVSWLQAERIAFNMSPSRAVKEQLSKTSFVSENQGMLADANVIANKTGATEFKLRKTFEAHYNMSYETFTQISIHSLLENSYFQKAIDQLRVAGTDQMISETMRNRAIRIVLQHLLRVVESDVDHETKLNVTRDITQILGYLQFDIDMTYKKYADELAVTLTPEVVPRALKQDHKLGRIIKRLESLGVGIKLDIAPLRQQPKLKTTGSAA